MHSPGLREKRLFFLVNSKLGLNKARFQDFLDASAVQRIFPNYHDKAELLECLDYGDLARFDHWVERRGYDRSLRKLFKPISRDETLASLQEQLRTGAVSRKDARKCELHERKNEVLRSLFGSYVFHAFPEEALHRHFNPDCRSEYHADFYKHLLAFHGNALHRDCALIFLTVDDEVRRDRSAEELRDALCSFVRTAYERLANHCFLAILIRPFGENGENAQWTLYSDLVLYAEKHRETPLQSGYFRPQEIEKTTSSHIPDVDKEGAHFELANEGFFFRDCFVLSRSKVKGERSKTTEDAVDLLLLFDKNERDETVIPCPGCRSLHVAGNSYPALGVRSWECQNSICPDRSAFDRGNRYSLSALIKQEAIKSDADQIPESSLRKWKLDVVFEADEESVSDMLIRHFSLHGDAVVLVNGPRIGEEKLGRRVKYEDFNPALVDGCHEQFRNSAYFKRFVVDRESPSLPVFKTCLGRIPDAQVFQGDCFEILSSMPAASLGGAVTSPPYYNARSYSVWPNIYCYLYDMYNSARQVFRVLKPGSLYLFNIFDYFDNENNIVFSAMGKKRMILGAYVIDLFRRVGFELSNNVVWYKGEIEGKRNFNQGNKSPYYQFPFNCWEHTLVFRKPGPAYFMAPFPTILDSKPVIKMIRGENVLGHSAPFPATIPELLLSRVRRGETVLDPYSGSMTTGRAAHRRGMPSVSIELHKEYCDLGLRLLEEENATLDLFPDYVAPEQKVV
jgi:DNA modification methylase